MRMSHGAYFLTAWQDGKQKWIPLGRDFGEAFNKYRELSAYETPTGRSVDDMATRFELEEIPKLKPNSQRVYKLWIPHIRKTWGRMPVASIRQPHVATFLDQYPHKVTANRVATLLCTMLKRAKRWGWIDVNYLEGMDRNPEERRTRRITDEEWQSLLGTAHKPYDLLLRLAMCTALRRSDICGLRWSNVKDDRLVVTTAKTQAPISFQLVGELAAIVNELKRGITPFPTRPLFCVAGGRPLTSTMLGHHYDLIRERAGLEDINFHDIRRTRITYLTEKYGKDFAQRVATHADPKTTARYFVPDAVRIDWPDDEIRGTASNKRQ